MTVRLPAHVVRHQKDLLAALTLALDPGPVSRGVLDLFSNIGMDCYRTAIVLLFELCVTEIRIQAGTLNLAPVEVVRQIALELAARMVEE